MGFGDLGGSHGEARLKVNLADVRRRWESVAVGGGACIKSTEAGKRSVSRA